ncbi:MAG: hypothetical protein C0467_30020 [Planctomycetaceae bacterium]|nr:hypothetical protein [Planctomycetaceae bacterium]
MAKAKRKPSKRKAKAVTFTPAEQRFIDEMIVEPNATRAYRLAHPECTYATARTEGSKYLANPNIKNEIQAARNAQRARTQVEADAVIEVARQMTFSDLLHLFEDDGVTPRPIGKVPPETRRMIASVKVAKITVEKSVDREGWHDVTTTTTSQIVEYKLWPKPKGLDKLWAHLGLTQEITPLESLLLALPPELSQQVREALAGPLHPAGGSTHTGSRTAGGSPSVRA